MGILWGLGPFGGIHFSFFNWTIIFAGKFFLAFFGTMFGENLKLLAYMGKNFSFPNGAF